MSLHTDIPSRAQIERLMTSRDPSSVSVYLPTDPTSRGAAERVAGAISDLFEPMRVLEVPGPYASPSS